MEETVDNLTNKNRPGANPWRSLQVQQVSTVLLYNHVPHLKRQVCDFITLQVCYVCNLDENLQISLRHCPSSYY